MDLSVFFEPVSVEISQLRERLPATSWGKNLPCYDSIFPAWEYADLVLIGCKESRGSDREGMAEAAQAVRNRLYALSMPDEAVTVVDLGNLKAKESPEKYYESLGYVLQQLNQMGKIAILIGGSQDLTIGQFQAYDGLETPIQYVQIDSRLDVEDASLSLNHLSYNHYLLEQYQQQIFQYTNLGYQSYFVSQEHRNELSDKACLLQRYGDLHANIRETEPSLRTANIVSFDLSSIRHADAPASYNPSPGGFSAFEACRMARYAGLGYRIDSLLLSEFDPQQDPNEQTALLLAMMIWYFVEGFYNRKEDQPLADRSNLRKYSVRLHASVTYINFFEHPQTGRWWMEVPYPDALEDPKQHNLLVPCSKKDYEFAQQDDIPERWWKVFTKLQSTQ